MQNFLLSLNEKHAKAFLLAMSLLSRFPVGHLDIIKPQDSGRSALYYPLVGLIIGVIIYLPAVIFPNVSVLLLAAIIVTLWAVITGALHLDGLADSADGWLGGMGNIEKTTQIMKDSHVGTAGVVVIVCLLFLKFSAVTALLQSGSGTMIIIAPLIGRAMILLLFVTTEYVNKQGMAKEIVEELPREFTWWVIAVSVLIAILFSFWGMVSVFIGFWLLRRLMLKILGGCTGDTGGATIEVTEMLWLVSIALFT